jgi:predicted phosphate transport protein (TIGR00153 family)
MKNASDLMIEFIDKGTAENSEDFYNKIKTEERKGDALSNKIFDELNTTFITPFDREDIHHLATRMDDVTDFINSAAKRIFLYKPKQMPPGAKELAIIIKEGAVTLEKAINELDILKKSRKRVSEYCTELHVLENKADDIFNQFLINLFENQHDSVELIKQKEIMYELEKATDTTESVGKIIKTIIVKYA